MNAYPELEKSFGCFNKNASEGLFLLQNYFKEKLEARVIEKAVLLKEFKLAQRDLSFDWKYLAEKHNFIFYQVGMTERTIRHSFDILIREFLNPENVMQEMEFRQLEHLLFDILNRLEWSSFQDITRKCGVLFSRKVLDYYNLIKYYNLYGYRFFEIQRNAAIEDYKIRKREYDLYSSAADKKKYRRILLGKTKNPRLTDLSL